jgi:DNA modification methylase
MAANRNSNKSLRINSREKDNTNAAKSKEAVGTPLKNQDGQRKSEDITSIVKAPNQSKEELEIEKVKKKEDKLISEEKINIAFSDKSHEPTKHLILNKNNQSLPEIPEGSVHLAVTSPPYFNAREYSTWTTIQDYLEDMNKSFKEVFRVLKPGRKFCLNISDLPEKGGSGVRWIPLGPQLLLEALAIGFELVDRVIWFKTPMKGFQYGSLPYPPSPLICDSMEYIYILRKPNLGKTSYEHVSHLQKEASRLPREVYAEYTKQIWTLRRVRLKGNEAGHIAPFPYEIPERCVRLYSFVGETVIDPFAGSGTTAQAAIKNRRNSIMVEMDSSYIEIMKQKIKSVNEDDQLIQLRPFGSFEIKVNE